MLRSVLVTLALAALAACGSTTHEIHPSSPFEQVHARFFDDAADFIREPITLGGQWGSDWDEELRGRVGYADTIAVVRIETLRTSIDVERRRTFHLVCTVDRLIRGELPDPERLEVGVAEGTGGFETIARNERRLVEGNYLLFVKWVDLGEEAGGEVVPRWHLSPASPRAMADLNRMLTEASEH